MLVFSGVVFGSTKVINNTAYPVKVIISGGAFPTTEWWLAPGASDTRVTGIKGGLCPTDFIALIKEDVMTDYPDPNTQDPEQQKLIVHAHKTAGWCGATRIFTLYQKFHEFHGHGADYATYSVKIENH